MIITQLAVLKMDKWCDVNTGCESFISWNLTSVVVFGNIRMDKDNSMTVDWDEFLHHIILNPVDNIGELVSSWKHSLVWSFPLCFTFTQRLKCLLKRWSVKSSCLYSCRCLMSGRAAGSPLSSLKKRQASVLGGHLLCQQDWRMLCPGPWRHP